MTAGHHKLNELLEYAPGLRALAIRLVGPVHADDLVQETWLKAARRPPAKEQPAGPWLVRVLTNSARSSAKQRSRHRDLDAAAHEESIRHVKVPTPAEIGEELDAAERLMAAINRLPSQQQTAISMSYFRGLTSQEIGSALGIPPSTVRWHLQQAVAALRSDLAGDQSSFPDGWVAALAPLVRIPVTKLGGALPVEENAGVAGKVSLGTFAPWLAAAGAILAAAIVLWAGRPPGQDPTVPPSVESGAPVDHPGEQVHGLGEPMTAGARESVAEPRPMVALVEGIRGVQAEPSEPTAPSTGPGGTNPPVQQVVSIKARLCSGTGSAIPGARLELAGAPHTVAVADSEGYCTVKIQGPAVGPNSPLGQINRARCLVASDGKGLRANKSMELLLGMDLHLGDIVLFPASPLEGVVVTPSGAPIPGAELKVPPSAALGSHGKRTTTNPLGQFLLEHAPEGQVTVTATGYKPLTLEVGPPRHRGKLRLQLTEDSASQFLSVLVTDPDHRPLPDALVEVYGSSMGGLVLRADAQGEVRAPLPDQPFTAMRCWDHGGRFAMATITQLAQDGSRQVVRLRHAKRHLVEVLDKRGEAVDGFRWTYFAPGLGISRLPRTGVVSQGHKLNLAVERRHGDSGSGGSLLIEATGYREIEAPLGGQGSPSDPVQINVGEPRLLEGIVEANGAPVPDALIQIVAYPWHMGVPPPQTQSVTPFGSHAVRTDEEGRFAAPVPAVGPFAVGVTANGLAPFLYQSMGFGFPTGLKRIELAPGGTLAGNLMDTTSTGPSRWPRPWTHYSVECLHESGLRVTEKVSTTGMYQVPGLAPGRWSVQVQRSGKDAPVTPIGKPLGVEVSAGALATLNHLLKRK